MLVECLCVALLRARERMAVVFRLRVAAYRASCADWSRPLGVEETPSADELASCAAALLDERSNTRPPLEQRLPLRQCLAGPARSNATGPFPFVPCICIDWVYSMAIYIINLIG